MDKRLKEFILSNSNNINANRWAIIYFLLDENFSLNQISLFTSTILDAGINPLNYLQTIPQGFLGSSFNKSSFTVPEGVKYINPNAFHNAAGLKEINLPKSLKVIRAEAFSNNFDLHLINYSGTREEWEAIEKASDWNDPPYITTVKCIDGELHYYGNN